MKEGNKFSLLICLILFACNKDHTSAYSDEAYRGVKSISYNSVSVDLIVEKPKGKIFDVLLVFHGTVRHDSLILQAANNILEQFKNIITREGIIIVSVAYPEENILFGDNIVHCEAALLWVKNRAANELGVKINKIFLAGHSQGAYLVTRLNTMHQTDGVVANAPGPLNLVFRCQLEERGLISKEMECTLLYNKYGATSSNENEYFKRSLLNFTKGFKSDILFIQGLDDGPIHMHSWEVFKQQVTDCNDCRDRQFLELPGFGHAALFYSQEAKIIFNQFISR